MIQTVSITRVPAKCAAAAGRIKLMTVARASWSSRLLGVLKQSFLGLSLWITLPLAIWLSSGWLGLLIVLQALFGAANLSQIATPDRRRAARDWMGTQERRFFEGEAPCVLIKTEIN